MLLPSNVSVFRCISTLFYCFLVSAPNLYTSLGLKIVTTLKRNPANELLFAEKGPSSDFDSR